MILFVLPLYCRSEDTTWAYRYLGPYHQDIIYSFANMSDGGSVFVLSGRLVRIGPAGNILWQRQAPFSLLTVAETGSGEILAASAGCNQIPDCDPTLYSFDERGRLLWQKKYALPGFQSPFRILPFSVGCLLAAIEYDSSFPPDRNLVLYRIGQSGELIWSKRFRRFNPSSVAKTDNDGVVALGKPNVSVLKISGSGNVLWEKRFGRGSESISEIVCAQGSYLVLTRRLIPDDSGPRAEIALRAISTTGELLWQKFFKSQKNIEPVTLEVMPDRILIGGARQSTHSWASDAFLMETDLIGTFRRIFTFGDRNYQAIKAVKSSSGHLFVVVNDTPAFEPGPVDRNLILKFPDTQWIPVLCNGLRDSSSPVATYDLPTSRILRVIPATEQARPRVVRTHDVLTKTSVTRKPFCGAE